MINKEDNKIRKVVYIKGKLKLLSPMLIGNGENQFTDNDLIRDMSGNPFIPGTGIAGTIRNSIEKIFSKNEDLTNVLFGSEEYKSIQSTPENKKYTPNQSLLYFYDSTLIKKGTISMRDGIAVDEFIKTAKIKEYAKYDYEILERDNEFDFKLELCLRNKFENKEKDILEVLSTIISELEKGKFYLGAKINRGLGSVKLTDTEGLIFDFNNLELSEKLLEEFLEFKWNKEFCKISKEAFKLGNDFIQETRKYKSINNIYTHIRIPLKVRDTIFIRNYLLQNTDVDSKQLNYNGKLIIPGTTWAGAINHRMFITLYDLGLTQEQSKEKIEELFGYTNKKGKSMSSRIRFGESIDKDKSKFVTIRRAKIDRFTGGASNKGLFDGQVAVHGNVFLDIYIRDQKQWEMGLLILSIYDLMSGMLTIGGETSVGRGLVVADDDFSIKKELILINGQPLCKTQEKEYFKKFKEEIQKCIGGI